MVQDDDRLQLMHRRQGKARVVVAAGSQELSETPSVSLHSSAGTGALPEYTAVWRYEEQIAVPALPPALTFEVSWPLCFTRAQELHFERCQAHEASCRVCQAKQLCSGSRASGVHGQCHVWRRLKV